MIRGRERREQERHALDMEARRLQPAALMRMQREFQTAPRGQQAAMAPGILGHFAAPGTVDVPSIFLLLLLLPLTFPPFSVTRAAPPSADNNGSPKQPEQMDSLDMSIITYLNWLVT